MNREIRRKKLIEELEIFLSQFNKKLASINYSLDLEPQLKSCFTILIEIHQNKLLEKLEEEKDRKFITWLSKFDSFNDVLYHILHFEHVTQEKIESFRNEFQELFIYFQEYKEQFITKK